MTLDATMRVALMPLLVYALASEMVFVVDAQLRRKKAPRVRRLRALRQLLRALHAEHIAPDDALQSHHALARAARGRLGRIANAPSLLCVNARAMDALYDAVRRGVQRRVVAWDSDALLRMTLYQLDRTRRVAEPDDKSDDVDHDDGGSVGPLVDEMVLRIFEAYSAVSAGDWQLLRQRLLGVLQDPTGAKAVLSFDAPDETEEKDSSWGTPGTRSVTIRYFDDDRQVCDHHSFLVMAASPPHSLRRRRVPNNSLRNVHEAEIPSMDAIVASATKRQQKQSASAPRVFNATASDALELLAGLLGSSTAEAKASGWKLSLFDDDSDDDDDAQDAVERITIDARSESKEMEALRDEWERATATGAKHGSPGGDQEEEEEDDDDDLLRLLDSSAKR